MNSLSPVPLRTQSRTLLGFSLLLLMGSLVLGYLNSNVIKGLRGELVTASSAREMADRLRAASARKLKMREAEFTLAQTKMAAAEARAASTEAELSKAQSDKAGLEAKLQTSESQIDDLQRQVADTTAGSAPGASEDTSPGELKAMLDETKQQLAAAEEEKTILADKVKAAQDRAVAIEVEKKRRASGVNAPGVHGTVLAVNQAYNFVVLNLGDRQGVVPNSEMLIMRQGALIGKIRISSVEPTTSIGDIMTNSLARGVQVQPGDTVIYAGSNNS
ncbi:MAG: hypothetical protein ACR2G0_06960 [Chthoniobacterales bacterium]